jgi:hypothetical protein
VPKCAGVIALLLWKEQGVVMLAAVECRGCAIAILIKTLCKPFC